MINILSISNLAPAFRIRCSANLKNFQMSKCQFLYIWKFILLIMSSIYLKFMDFGQNNFISWQILEPQCIYTQCRKLETGLRSETLSIIENSCNYQWKAASSNEAFLCILAIVKELVYICYVGKQIQPQQCVSKKLFS